MTETRPEIVTGIDAGKTALELSVAAGPARSCANNADSIADSVDELAGCWHGPVDLVEREPIGGCKKPSAAALRAAGTPTLKAHPNRVRAYAPPVERCQYGPPGHSGPVPLQRRLCPTSATRAGHCGRGSGGGRSAA